MENTNKSTKNTKLIFIGAAFLIACAAIALVLATLFSGPSAEDVEDTIYNYTRQYDLNDNIRWDQISVSAFGNITIDNIDFYQEVFSNQIPILNIEKMEILEFETSKSKYKADIKITGIRDGDNNNFFSSFENVAAAGITKLDPLNMSISWDLDLKKEEGTISVKLLQKDVVDYYFDLKLDQISKLISYIDFLDRSDNIVLERFMNRNLGRGSSIFSPQMIRAFISEISEIEIANIQITIKDNGFIPRALEVFKRHDIVIDLRQKSPFKERDKEFEKLLEEITYECEHNLERSFGLAIKLRREDCLSISNFISNKKNEIKFVSTNRRPIPLSRLFNSHSNQDPLDDFARLLGIKITN